MRTPGPYLGVRANGGGPTLIEKKWIKFFEKVIDDWRWDECDEDEYDCDRDDHDWRNLGSQNDTWKLLLCPGSRLTSQRRVRSPRDEADQRVHPWRDPVSKLLDLKSVQELRHQTPPEIDTPTTSRTLRNRSKNAALHRRRGDVWMEIGEGGGCWGARSGSETCVCVHGLWEINLVLITGQVSEVRYLSRDGYRFAPKAYISMSRAVWYVMESVIVRVNFSESEMTGRWHTLHPISVHSDEYLSSMYVFAFHLNVL